ncbi:MAG: DUF3458 domain-containing protein, partial [Pseudomonadota bacterium]
ALRARQFPEDAGPLAHPVRPESYIEINNFYTATVYEKGAEVIRMLRTLVGPEGYRRALDLYFERHDGQACTIEQFRQCFEDACGRDLAQFARWWSQAGTPRLGVEERWEDGTLTLTFRQRLAATPGQPTKAPMVIPVAYGVLGADGRELVPTTVFALEAEEASVSHELGDGAGRPVASLLRDFSAPVVLERETEDETRAFLLAHDTDPFNRWEAGRAYALSIALRLAAEGGTVETLAAAVPEAWCESLGRLVGDEALDPAFRALAMELPGNDEIAGEMAARGALADPDAIHAALSAMRRQLGRALDAQLTAVSEAMAVDGPYRPDAAQAGRRALRNRCLALRLATDAPAAHAAAEAQFDGATNMTDSLAALGALVHHAAPGAAARLADFRARWEADALVMDKWFAVQATAPLPDALARVAALTSDEAFSWRRPNRFRAVVASFALGNPVGFHAANGSGYRFVADWILRLDALNPQTAARVAGCFESWRRYEPNRQAAMRAALEGLAARDTLSRNTREIVERVLAD